MELAKENREYYRNYQFQALTEEHANDMMNLQGIEGERGFIATFVLAETMKKVIGSLDRTDFENLPQLSLRWPTRNDSRIEEFQNITRAEIMLDHMNDGSRVYETHNI